ncbi:MAG TPA: UDP-N-acetylmuramoyl-L-alanyl-D-glutamate--2,6-diaminopimelate ligase [Stellaceae bacterium]|nr:UDP-N-acetylmuramoyl-L-alanyl-D-glutamate--2,6-diaminopimelate ligase [Stellaceae bacterium]
MNGDLAASLPASAAPDIRGLTADSREVRPGWLFAALPGARLDGRRFIADAVRRGAVAVLTDERGRAEAAASEAAPSVALIADPNPRRRLALMAARFHAPQPATIAAVTGTNGKTSVAAFTRQIWQQTGTPAASLGTLGIIAPGRAIPGALTTPDPVSLHRELAELARRGVAHVAIEASSHGLDQFRLDGLHITAAAFTNLTQDHLDYHGTMAAYGAAKLRLFRELLPAGGTAVLNAESDAFERFAAVSRARNHRILAFGASPGADLGLIARRPLAHGQELDLDILGTRRRLVLPLVGAFQASNVLAALGLALAGGAPVQGALDALPNLEGVPGRLQLVASLANGAAVYVDYAHTPDALATVLAALRPHVRRRLIAVFGAGGDRDAAKRPLMGEAVARHADAAIVTDDNPRGEPPAAIRAAVLAGCPGAREIGDRAAAIRTAMAGLEAGDILVIAGKGHETGQIIAGTTLPFDDAAVARAVADELSGGAA